MAGQRIIPFECDQFFSCVSFVKNGIFPIVREIDDKPRDDAFIECGTDRVEIEVM